MQKVSASSQIIEPMLANKASKLSAVALAVTVVALAVFVLAASGQLHVPGSLGSVICVGAGIAGSIALRSLFSEKRGSSSQGSEVEDGIELRSRFQGEIKTDEDIHITSEVEKECKRLTELIIKVQNHSTSPNWKVSKELEFLGNISEEAGKTPGFLNYHIYNNLLTPFFKVRRQLTNLINQKVIELAKQKDSNHPSLRTLRQGESPISENDNAQYSLAYLQYLSAKEDHFVSFEYRDIGAPTYEFATKTRHARLTTSQEDGYDGTWYKKP